MLFLIILLVITCITVMVVAIKSADKEDFFDSICLYGESRITRGSNSNCQEQNI